MRYQWFWKRLEQLGLAATLAEEHTISASDGAPHLLMPTGFGAKPPLFRIIEDAALTARNLPQEAVTDE